MFSQQALKLKSTVRAGKSVIQSRNSSVLPSFHNTDLPDGDVPDVSKGGLPFRSIVSPFLLKVFEWGTQPMNVPLGRWKVNSCDEAFSSSKAATAVYDHGINTGKLQPPSTHSFYNSALPDGDVPDVSRTGFPVHSLVMPFFRNVISNKEANSNSALPLGRFKVSSCDNIFNEKKYTATTYDHSA